MSSATASGSTTNYVLNALGQRIMKSGGPAGTVITVYDEGGHLLGEYGATGGLIEETVWLGDTPVATIQPSGSGVAVYYVHADHINAPRMITRSSDNGIMWRWDTDPFGTAMPNQNPSGLGTFTYNLRYPGQYFDSETGTNYNYFRDYDPQTGRYLESDPMGLAAGVNTFAYVSSSPLHHVDPLGLQELCPKDQRCAELRRRIFDKSAALLMELLKYDPVADGRGGFPMAGGGTTKPGGHFKEIANLQQGIKNDIAEYKKLCSNDGGWPPVPRNLDEMAGRSVPEPVSPTPARGISLPSPKPNPGTTGAGFLALFGTIGVILLAL